MCVCVCVCVCRCIIYNIIECIFTINVYTLFISFKLNGMLSCKNVYFG